MLESGTKSTSRKNQKKQVLVALGIIIISTFLIRWIYHEHMLVNNPIYEYPIIDSKEYVNNAEYIAQGNWLGPSWPYFHPPLYTYFIALVFWLFGTSISLIRVIQILIDCVNIILLFLVARKLLNTKVALMSCVIYAFYIPIVLFSVELLPPVVSICLLLASMLFLLKYLDAHLHRTRHTIWLGIAGVCFGLLIVTLPNFLICLPFIIILLYPVFRSMPARQKIMYVLMFTVLTLIPALITTIRNYTYTGERVFISYNGGVNFYIGNNEDINTTVSIPPGVEWEKFTMSPYEQKRIENFAQASQYWYRKGLDYIKRKPLDWIWLMVKKTLLFFNAHEFPRNFDLNFFTQYSPVSKLPFFKLNFLLPLGLCGIVIIASRWHILKNKRGLVLAAVVFFSYTFSIILFFIAARYRLPIIPILIVPAAYTLYYLLHTHDRLRIIGVCILSLIFFGLVSAQFLRHNYPYTIPRTKTYALIGATLFDNKQYEKAHQYLNIGLKEPPDQYTYDLYHQLGLLYSTQGNSKKSIMYYRYSIDYKPDNFALYNDLASEYMTAGHPDSAMICYNKARELAPCCAKIYLNLVEVYYALGIYERIFPVLESYFTVCPSPHPIVSYTMGKFNMQILHDWDKAIHHIEMAIQYPHGFELSADVYNNLGICYYYRGNLAQAQRVWEQGLRLDSGNKSIQNNLQKLEQLP